MSTRFHHWNVFGFLRTKTVDNNNKTNNTFSFRTYGVPSTSSTKSINLLINFPVRATPVNRRKPNAAPLLLYLQKNGQKKKSILFCCCSNVDNNGSSTLNVTPSFVASNSFNLSLWPMTIMPTCTHLHAFALLSTVFHFPLTVTILTTYEPAEAGVNKITSPAWTLLAIVNNWLRFFFACCLGCTEVVIFVKDNRNVPTCHLFSNSIAIELEQHLLNEVF